jgi:hypothetical protein
VSGGAARGGRLVARLAVAHDSQDSVAVAQGRGFRKCSTVQPRHVVHQRKRAKGDAQDTHTAAAPEM